MADALTDGADWPLFGWVEDMRPALATAREGGRPVVLATLYHVSGSAPRAAGSQMLFDGAAACGYFSGDCIEGDVARHAAEVLAEGAPRHLHYGAGSPWMDIRLRCGGALHILLERIAPDCRVVGSLLSARHDRQVCRYQTDGTERRLLAGTGPFLATHANPFSLTRRCDPPRRVIVSGSDPGALALASLAAQAQFETILVSPSGPGHAPPLADVTYRRESLDSVLHALPCDAWTAYIGATHEDHHDISACLTAVRQGAGWVGMIGAQSRTEGRKAALRTLGAGEAELARIHFSPGIGGLGKAPWAVATGIMAVVMQALNYADDQP